MFVIAYHYAVRARHRAPLRFAYRSAREALQQVQGLLSHALHEPCARDQPFTLLLAWDSPSSFERFIRSWLGVWLVNGLGLEHRAFVAPIQTERGEVQSDPGEAQSGHGEAQSGHGENAPNAASAHSRYAA